MEPPSPSAEDVRSGVLFEDASDNEGPSTIDRHPNLSCVEVFPVNGDVGGLGTSIEQHNCVSTSCEWPSPATNNNLIARSAGYAARVVRMITRPRQQPCGAHAK